MGVRELVGDSKGVPANEKVKNHCTKSKNYGPKAHENGTCVQSKSLTFFFASKNMAANIVKNSFSVTFLGIESLLMITKPTI